MKKTYKAILFDYDGTLIDTNRLIVDSWNHMYSEYCGGRLSDDDVKWTFGIPLREGVDRVMQIKGHSGYDLDELIQSYRSFQTAAWTEEAKLFDGVFETIKKLREKGVLLGIVTSRVNKSLIDGLNAYGMYDFFSSIVCDETTSIHKPLPEPALICCRELGVEPSEALMVGDSVFDLQCGNAAGCDSCFVTWSFATSIEKAMAEGHPTVIIDRPEQLLELV